MGREGARRRHSSLKPQERVVVECCWWDSERGRVGKEEGMVLCADDAGAAADTSHTGAGTGLEHMLLCPGVRRTQTRHSCQNPGCPGHSYTGGNPSSNNDRFTNI